MVLSDEAAARVYQGGRAEVEKLPTVAVSRHFVIEAPRPGYRNATLCPGWGDEIVSLWLPDSVEVNTYDVLDNGVRAPRTTLAHSVAALACVQSRDGVRTTELRTLDIDFPTVQRMPDDQLLVVGSRCLYDRAAGAEKNAALYDVDGNRIHRATFGDGIGGVRTTRRGDIWVGYFDEGVIGNNGWGLSRWAPEPIGSAGLIRFGPSLAKEWEFRATELGWHPITDCYALALDSDDVWVCYYTDFNIMRVRDGQVSMWFNDTVAGASSLVASGDQVGLIGGYLGEHDRIAVGTVADYVFQPSFSARITIEGTDIPHGSMIYGADGHVIVVTADGAVYRAVFDDWLAQFDKASSSLAR